MMSSDLRPSFGSLRGLNRWLVAIGVGVTLSLAQPVFAATTDPSGVVAMSVPSARTRLNQRVFDQVWNTVRRDYYDATLHGVDWQAARTTSRPQALAARNDRELYVVLERMLDLLDDAHAGVAPPAVVRRQATQREQRAVMGVSLYPEPDGDYRIERVRPGSPAAEAEIKPGWTLQALNGQTWGPEMDVVAGQPVSLTLRDGQGVRRDIVVTPRVMAAQPAFVADRSRPGVLVLRVEAFEPGLGRWMGAQLTGLSPETEVVLDLRANPGGLVIEADAVLSCFLPRDRPWATRTSRSGRRATFRTAGGCGVLKAPLANDLAVLVDHTSRSAAELTPAALQEADRALIVGQKTGGAVLISQNSNLPDGGQLTLSRADFTTSGGVRLEKQGVTPDVIVDGDLDARVEGRDLALEAAIASLRQGRVRQQASSVQTTTY